ncbi:hypothetical protein BC939DRAFT_494457 [Gamsiella multidivaricata]|uniref:uncharacterized protein n=1 Tax=Gamsiella multidivaricata TaxID=101098 RepID=UPI00221E9D11|nr:uncharacterized protein BC939DRAFT_494457 [Gamsiella multidivaricata]KAI7820621.1 hypothetical protein BC939DRAFT_494457 [Gamsiella multidivaricata]
MSFVFEWEKLDDEVALQIEGMIHAHFQRIPKPSFMGNIAVSKFRFGSTPPSITVLDVTDPLEEWYVHMDQEEARLAQEAAEAGGGESMDEDELASGDDYEDDYSYSADGSIVIVGEGDDIEYMEPGPFAEGEQLETEAWLQQQQGVRKNDASSGSDSYKEELQSNPRSRDPSSRNDGPAPEQNALAPTEERSNRNLGLDTDTRNLASASRGTFSSSLDLDDVPSAQGSGTTHSLSSHASDDEIESEAFYTQGESTIYQRMKNLVIDPSTPAPHRPTSSDGESAINHTHHPHISPTHFPPTPGGPNGNVSGGLGLGLGAGIGSSPGSVLSSVMQNRSTTRPLSAASFYSSPPSATTAVSSTNAGSGHPPPLHFPDLSGMFVSGNSLLGLRAGTPSRTIPGTPRGFESPTLAFSRRQSFSETGGDDSGKFLADDRPGALLSELQSREQDQHNPSVYMSPVEALSFDEFPQQPKIMEHLKDAESAAVRGGSSRNGSQSGRSLHGDQRSRSSSFRHHDYHSAHSERRNRYPDRRRRKREEGRGGYSQGEPRTPASYFPSPMPSKRHENDIQLLLSVQYQGQMGFTIETELLLNYPTFAFLALPVKLVITGFSFKAKVLMGYLRDHVNVCFLEPEDSNESILSNVRIESQVGDEQKQAVLKNVGKIERFVVEQLRKFITEDFVYPSYHSIELTSLENYNEGE